MPLRLDLVRHGEALPVGSEGDSGRALSEAGRSAVERLAANLAQQGWRPDRAFVSPMRRAQESALILLRHGPPTLKPEILDELVPDHEPADILEALSAHGADRGHVLLVGHQPLLGRLVAYLEGRAERGLPPAALVRIRCDGAPAQGSGKVELELRP
ncbi:MAG TPA: phosphohistidine phosphatase SixA [Candidatus Eisenbacteria bacterium]